MARTLPWRTAWITGASSGIGREVALGLARAGVEVVVSARRADQLADLAAGQPRITTFALDVTDRAAVGAAVPQIAARLGAIDLALLNAGVWHPMGASSYDADKAVASMAVNYLGIVHALEPLIVLMTARGKGQIAMTGSVAGYRGLPQATAYAPSKAAVIALAESLRPDLARKGVTVSVVNPGFVETPMTAVNDFPMPFLITTEQAARLTIAGLSTGRFEVAYPWQMTAMMKIARILPYRAFFWYARKFLMPAGTSSRA